MTVDMTMGRKLYQRIEFRDGSHGYAALVHGRHSTHVFARAQEAQARSERVKARYERLWRAHVAWRAELRRRQELIWMAAWLIEHEQRRQEALLTRPPF